MILVYPRGVRIIIHTANLIYVDWNNKSQGLWMQDFPWKEQTNPSKGCPFENDLIDYLSALKVILLIIFMYLWFIMLWGFPVRHYFIGEFPWFVFSSIIVLLLL